MKERPKRFAYRQFYPLATRWMDNDQYGHMNNVVYYSFFDTVINLYLIGKGGLDIRSDRIVGYVAASGCTYLSPVGYPDLLEAGLRVERLGTSSVQYGVALFKRGDEEASAHGHVVHVFVDREANRPAAIPAGIRAALKEILVLTE